MSRSALSIFTAALMLGVASTSVAAPAPRAVPTATAPPPRSADVVINGVALTPAFVAQMRRIYGSVAPGRYWYDRISGLWGLEGGPYMGQIAAGLNLGGPLSPYISGRGTGTFINGREIHRLEYMALLRAYGTVSPGRFWLIADGTYGFEGGPALGNLRPSGGGGGGRSSGGSWSSYSPFAGTVGGDGSGCTYFNGGGSSWSNC